MLLAALAVPLVAACGTAPEAELQLADWDLVRPGQVALGLRLPTRAPATDRPDRYTLRTTVQLPPHLRGRALRVVFPDLAAIPALRAQGQLIPLEDPGRGFTYRRRGPHAWGLPASIVGGDELDLELVVERRWSTAGWILTIPRVTRADTGSSAGRLVEIFNLHLSLGAALVLCQIALISFIIYVGTRQREHLWLALQSLCASFYPIWISGVSQDLFGYADTAVLCLCLTTGAAVSVEYLLAFFGLPRKSALWWMLAIACWTAALVTWRSFRVGEFLGPLAIAFVSALIVRQLVTLARLARVRVHRSAALLQIGGWLAVAVASTFDAMVWLGIGDPLQGVRLGGLGLASFGLLGVAQIARKHIETVGHTAELNVELLARVEQLDHRRTEIEVLNTELRRQIGDRAQQIYEALALAGRGPGELGELGELHPGQILQGRYRIERALGAGGMGEVYETTRLSDGRKLALKRTHERDGAMLARLAREAQIAATVSHENLVGIVDVDVASGGFLFIVMELVDGVPLSSLLKPVQDASWTIPVLEQIALGLAALHAAGIVHRDLKPGNVLIDERGGPGGRARAKIADFGISLQAEPAGDLLAPRRVAVADGTPATLSAGLAALTAGPAATTAPAALRAQLPTAPQRTVSAKQLLVPPPRGSRPPAPELTAQTVIQLAAPSPPRLKIPGPPELAGPASSAGGQPRSTHGSSLTRTGLLPGTPAYIAPELARGRGMLTSAADMFAFGVIAHELLTGKRPFLMPPVISMIEGRQPEPAAPLASARPDLPGQVTSIVDACLSFDPQERPSAERVAVLLAPLTAQQGVVLGAPPDTAVAPPRT